VHSVPVAECTALQHLHTAGSEITMTDTMQLRKQNSGGFGSSGSSQENLSNVMYNAANYNTIMVEYENGNREMAVDVPASFVAQAKTPPRYPPSNPRYQPTLSTFSPRHQDQNSSTSSKMSKSSSRGREGSNGSAGAPPTRSRDHLRIDPDGHLANKAVAPEPPSRPHNGTQRHSVDSTQSNGENGNLGGTVRPSKEQYERIAKYQAEIKAVRQDKESRLREDEFLRNSMRQSDRLRALETSGRSSRSTVRGVSNAGYSTVGEEPRQPSAAQVSEALQRLKLSLPQSCLDAVYAAEDLVSQPDFRTGLEVCHKLQAAWCYSAPPTAACCDAQELAEDCLSLSDGTTATGLEHEPAAQELAAILRKESLEGLLYVHDKLAERYSLLNSLGEDDVILDRVSHYAEPNIKVVKLEKTSEPLGATVKNENESVVVGRIIKGGAADRSGLLHEGDEILEVNEVELRGKNVNEVCDILARMTGTLTMLVVPVSAHNNDSTLPAKPAVVHLKAQIDYEAEDDNYVPCRELGISFHKGDILHVINQVDPHWWQAYREGEENTLAGLIPSPDFHSTRVSMKQTIADEVGAVDVGGGGGGRLARQHKSKGFLCARRSNKRKKKEVPYSAGHYHDSGEMEAEGETIVYEEVTLYYPRPNKKRPVVLIGPPNIGRHELRQRLMADSARFSAAIPHTSRTRREEEQDGADYHFISRLQFEQDILARKFVEHGEYEKAYYGTSLGAIRSVVNSEKICVLNLHPQSLKILKSSDLMPYVVFVAPPSLQQLKRWKMDNLEQVDDDELEEIIERAREMEERYGHYFDMIIIYSDPDRAYQQLLDEINLLEREPQWVPAAWVRKEQAQSFY